MRKIQQSQRANGSARGGVGGGYEITDPDWDIKRLNRMKIEYLQLDAHWQKVYMQGLSSTDQRALRQALNRDP